MQKSDQNDKIKGNHGRPFTKKYLEIKSKHPDDIGALLSHVIALLSAQLAGWTEKIIDNQKKKE